MDFWAHQEDAKRRTARLVVLYAVMVALFALVTGFTLDFIWRHFVVNSAYFRGHNPFTSSVPYSCATFILALVGILCLFSPASLSAGGRSVAEALKGTLVPAQARNPGERRLLNVVEEISLASGMPVPPVYILEREKGINAFAAGRSINDAVVGVTRGALDQLSRDELQAVVAHEFSHILNGDMRLNLRFVRLFFGLMCLSDFSATVLRWLARGSSRRGGSRKGNKGLALLILLAVVVYLFGVVMAFVGTIIQAAVNRQREFLADASSVQFTRSTALASALKKIDGLSKGSKLANTAMTGSYGHLFFCSIHAGLFDTHPPLAERIRRLDPLWEGISASAQGVASSGAEPEDDRNAPDQWEQLRNRSGAAVAWLGQVRGISPLPEKEERIHPFTADEAEILLRGACREPLEASYMILGLLLDARDAVRDKQLASMSGSDAPQAVQTYHRAFSSLKRDLWLPLVELAIPALKTLSEEQFRAFCGQMTVFINADGVFSCREWVLQQLIRSQAGAQFESQLAFARKRVPDAAAMVLSALAKLSPDADAARRAFDDGRKYMTEASGFVETLLSPEKLSGCVAVLAGSPAKVKLRFIRAASRIVMHDGRIDPEEAMFLRLLSLCLGIPVPPEPGP
ncbi:MAG: M48 family metallopeptidase [Deltaproteobacteria bacterium]|nr:M48 family metallopeptidase [Deltaproteobacteria bacterium]